MTILAFSLFPTVWANAADPTPSDVATVDAIIAASFDALSGPVGAPRQWDRYMSLLDPDARLVSVSIAAETGAPKIVRWSRDEYARAVNSYLVESGFLDRKLRCITNQFGSVAASRCGFEGLEQTKRVERGVAMYQLYHNGQRWWILSVVWTLELPGHSIPVQLLRDH